MCPFFYGNRCCILINVDKSDVISEIRRENMSNEKKTMTDKLVESADFVYGTVTERTIEHMKQAESNFEKDVDVAKKASSVVMGVAEIVIEAEVDRIVGLLNGEKIDLEKEKSRVIETIDKIVDKADAYYSMITDRVIEKLKQHEQSVEEDIEIGKELVNKLHSNS